MKKLAVTLVIAIVLGAVIYTFADPPMVPTRKTVFTVTEVQPTDGGLVGLDEAVFGKNVKPRWNDLLPRNRNLVDFNLKHMVVPKSWLRGQEIEAEASGRPPSTIYLFGSRVEDQVSKDGRVFRPFFRGMTKAGSVVAGQSLRRLKTQELHAVIRIIGDEATIITFK